MPDVFEVASPLRECLLHCEVECVRECCGIEAFATEPGRIAEWGRQAGPAVVAEALQQIAELVAVAENRTQDVRSEFLNHYTCDEDARARLLAFLSAFREGLTSLGGSDG